MKEIKSLRKSNEKHFLNDDGSITAYVYKDDIHYLKDGKYEEIDNTIIQNGTTFINKDNAFHTTFQKDLKNNLIVDINKDNHYLKMYLNDLKNDNCKVTLNNKQVSYKNILDDIDFDYQVISTKLKESIILKNKDNIPNTLSFLIETDLNITLNNKKLEAKDKDNVIFVIDAPYMWDSKENYNYNISYDLYIKDNKYFVSLNLDKEWLNKAEFPVVIDPTIKTNSVTSDAYICSGEANLVSNNDMLKIGVDNSGNIYRSLMKFSLPEIGTGCEVIQAYLNLFTHPRCYNWLEEADTDAIINAHQIDNSWNEATCTWNNSSNLFNARVEDFFYGCRSIRKMEYTDDNSYVTNVLNVCSIDLTNLVKKWYAGTVNNGVMLKLNEEVYKSEFPVYEFVSNDNELLTNDYGVTYPNDNSSLNKPFLIVVYRNLNGLEDYMSYKTISFIDGASYVNNLTGNLTTVFNLNETIGGKYPISLNMVYNTNDVVLNNNTGYGLGYKLSLHETIKEVSIENEFYLEYLDEDGTLHYFVLDINENGEKIDNQYIDEDGLGFTATKENNKYIVKDKSGNKMVFVYNTDIYYLTELINTKGDKVTITYDTNKKISKIIDANNSVIDITYNSNSTIITSNHRTTTINYVNNQIVNIETKNGKTLFQYYDYKTLKKITDINGISYNFTYYDKPYKINTITELGLNQQQGKSLSYTYGFLVTRVQDEKNRVIAYSFNTRGNNVGVTNLKEESSLDEAYGRGMVYNGDKSYKQKSDGTFFEKPSRATNNLQNEILPVKYTKNYFKNSSFEIADNNYNITNDCARSGDCSLKINNGDSLTITLLDNNTYTFSGYFKNESEILLTVTTDADATGPYYVYSGTIPINEEFTRHSFTFTLPVNKTHLFISFTSPNVAYLDDVQIEEGEIANYYNLLENGDFSDGLTGWQFSGNTLDGDGVVILENGIRALKINPKPQVSKSLTKTIKGIKGTKTTNESGIGDMYYLSFWYKNTGLNKQSSDMMGGNGIAVLLNFGYTDDYEFPGCAIPVDINSYNDEWQFYSVPFYADSAGNYENLYFTLFASDNVNEFYITNITLTKDVKQHYNISNEDTGNLDRVKEVDGRNTEFKYDKNNQLISMFNPKGNNFKFEYDNDIPDRILKGISPSGISNEIKYDNNGNPIKTLINNVNPDNEIVVNKNYYIRLKGTNKYVTCDFETGTLKLTEDNCSHDAFLVRPAGTNYFFEHVGHFIVALSDGIRITKNVGGNAPMILIKNDNGSFGIKSFPHQKMLACINDELQFSDNNTKEEDMEFYFEDIDTPMFIESKAEYTSDGRFLNKTIDALGNETLYDINTLNGLTNSITDANLEVTNYTYNSKEQITKVEKNNKEVNYSYNSQNLLSNITSGNKNYQFDYDDFLNVKDIKINNQTLVTNTYEENNGNLIKSTYGNGDSTNYTYDELDRVKTVVMDNHNMINYYDNVGNLVKVKDTNFIYSYGYDIANKINGYKIGVDNNSSFWDINYKFDNNDNITQRNYLLNGDKQESISYSYNSDDEVIKVNFDSDSLNYKYDYLGRLISKDINNQNKQEFTYITQGNKTSNIVDSVKVNNDLYKYKYDKLYNITDIFKNNELINHYEYDNFNELIKENDYINNKMYKYTYDLEGNILKKEIYNLTNSTLIDTNNYQYNNTNWEDQLTKYNNTSITYDEIGNPVTIGNNTLTWMNGRQLFKFENNDLETQYVYDINGIRNYKTVNGVTTHYLLENNKIIFETTSGNVIYYIRDDEGRLVGFKYNNTKYYYIKNLQDDIIGIMDSSFNTIVSYEYDSWGKVISIKDNNGSIITDTSHIGIINPYRYRGYYYDNETGYYYLNSRYYNPEWGRFINSDRYVCTNQGMLSTNMYIYTENNPITRADTLGIFWFQIARALISGGISVVVNGINNISNGENFFAGGLGVFFGSAFAGGISTLKVIPKGIREPIANYGGSLIENVINGSDNIIVDTIIGGMSNQSSSEMYSINDGWIQPQRISTSITGNYQRKASSNDLYGGMKNGKTQNLKKQYDKKKKEKDEKDQKAFDFLVNVGEVMLSIASI